MLSYNPQPPLIDDLIKWSPTDMPDDEMRAQMDICCFSGVACMQQVVHDMTARGSGALFMTVTTSAIEPIATLTPTSMGFAAARNYMFSLNEWIKEHGVRAHCMTLGLLVEKGDPHGDPDVLGAKYLAQYQTGESWEVQVRTDVDPHQHHIDDMERFDREIPTN
ncbi:SDR family oxidoreductase [Actibacterium sp. D379-3]